MRRLAAVAIATTIVAGAAGAQMKVGVQTKPTGKPAANSVTLTQPADAPLESARRIERAEAQKLVKQGKAVYVDVRAKTTYDESHIKGAMNIPLSELVLRMRELPPGKMIITYCA